MELVSAALWHESRRRVPKPFASGSGVNWDADIKESRQHASRIRFNDRHGPIKGEGRDRIGGVSADPGKFSKQFWIARESSVVIRSDRLSSGVKVARAAVITES